jgi:hypothetical protein
MNESDINFLISLASERGIKLSRTEAIKAHKTILKYCESDEDYYYEAKSYFQN